jgi:PAS domain S-box-containing protein
LDLSPPTAQRSAWRDPARLHAFAAFDPVDLEPDVGLDALARLAAQACGAPTAQIDLVGQDRCWTAGAHGPGPRDLPCDQTICAEIVGDGVLATIVDTGADPRSATKPMVVGGEGFGFYAAAPLLTAKEGQPIGVLCVVDLAPRPSGLTADQAFALETLAAQAMIQLELRRTLREHRDTNRRLVAQATRLRESGRRFQSMAESMPQMVWSANADGEHDYFNSRWFEYTGLSPDDSDRTRWRELFHPDDRAEAGQRWREALATAGTYEVEYRLRRADGAYRWVLGRAKPVLDDEGRVERWLGTCTDIHDIKQAAAARELLSQELSHRIKNIFAVVSSLISLSVRHHPQAQGFSRELRERVSALAKAHELVRLRAAPVAGGASISSLKALLTALLEPYSAAGGGRLIIEGDDVSFDDGAATPLALVFHELATNCAKYGAWSAEGAVEITVRVDGERLSMDWRETGGPPVDGAPARQGFGASLARLSVESQLHGALEMRWSQSGLCVGLSVPTASLNRRTAAR